jgi:hypothetical protein
MRVSTNAGGTPDLCARGSDGFDSNAASHFEVMSNELNTTLLLICPKDRSRKRAATFDKLRPENVTYWLWTGTNISETSPKQVLAVCPVDGTTLYSDGSVSGNKEEIQENSFGQPMDVGGAGR